MTAPGGGRSILERLRSYEAGGKQYIVIAAGGSAKIDKEGHSDAVIAFALP